MSHSHAVDFKKAFAIEELADSQVKISGELPYVELESERQAALVTLGKNVTIDGFRKGNVPQLVLEKHLGEMTILIEMAERAIAHAYPHILETHDIDAIGQPKIEITKIAKDNPLGFSATVAVIPKFDLPDYKKIAKDTNAARAGDEVSEAELETKIQDILRQKAAYEKLQAKAVQKTDDSLPDLPTPETAVPIVLTDELVKSLGTEGQFASVADFKQKLREHLEIEKKTDNAARHRANLTDAVIDATTITLPRILVDSEISQMFASMQEDLDRADLKMEDYLAHIKKTKEELTAEWTPAAEKRARLQLILNEIARAEKITPDVEKVEAQTKQLLERFKDADEYRVKLYVASVLMNEDVMQRLETM